MKIISIRKTFAIICVLITGGIVIGLISLIPHTAEAAITMFAIICVLITGGIVIGLISLIPHTAEAAITELTIRSYKAPRRP